MRRARLALLGSALAWAAGCGGGGGGSGDGGSAGFDAPPAQRSVDEFPSGQVVDVATQRYFTLTAGSRTVFRRDYEVAGGNPIDVYAAGADSDEVVVEDRQVDNYLFRGDRTTLRMRSGGIDVVSPLTHPDRAAWWRLTLDVLTVGFNTPTRDWTRESFPALDRTMAVLPLFVQPLQPVGSTRRLLREGSLEVDLDGDTHPEGYRVEFLQTLVGFETLDVRGFPIETVHFRHRLNVTLVRSRVGDAFPDIIAVSSADVWWGAGGLGMVQDQTRLFSWEQRDLIASDLNSYPYRRTIRSGTVNQERLFMPAGRMRELALAHHSLVYSPVRARYYATAHPDPAHRPSRIAEVDPATGAIRWGSDLGVPVGRLAASGDGSMLYVLSVDSGELIQLALPGLTEIGRVRVPMEPNGGGGTYQPRTVDVAASPTDSSLVAVAIEGVQNVVRIYRNLQPWPRVLSGWSGGIAFSEDGQAVFVGNVVRAALAADGLVQTHAAASGNVGFSRPQVRGASVYVGSQTRSTADLGEVTALPIGSVGPCRLGQGQGFVCDDRLRGGFDAPYAVFEGVTGAQTATLTLGEDEGQASAALEPGPSGAMARSRPGRPNNNEPLATGAWAMLQLIEIPGLP